MLLSIKNKIGTTYAFIQNNTIKTTQISSVEDYRNPSGTI
jgi:hypothetical protein